MGFFTNIINYIKNIDIKTYFKKVIPSKQNLKNITNIFRRHKKPERTSDAEYGFTSQTPSTNRVIVPTAIEHPQEPIYLKIMESKSVVGVVEPTSRLDDPTSHEERDIKIGRPSIYTDRTQFGINRLMNHLNHKKAHRIAVPELQKKTPPKKPKRISHEMDDLKVYILDSINEIEIIRHQIHMKMEIVKTIECNEPDLETVKEYLTSCMIEIEDIDAKGTSEIQSTKEDALYYTRQWYNKLNAQLKVQQDAAEDVYVRVTLAQLDAVKLKINKLSSEAKAKDVDSTDVIRRLSQYIDDIESVNTKRISQIETIKRVTLQLAEELTESIQTNIISQRSEFLQTSNDDCYNTQIDDEDIYDEVSITSSSENISIHISDSDTDDDSVKRHVPVDNIEKNNQARQPSQFFIPDILIDTCEPQEQAIEFDSETNKLSVKQCSSQSGNSKSTSADCSKKELTKSADNENKLKSNLNQLKCKDNIQLTKSKSTASSSSSSSSSCATIHQELQQAKRIARDTLKKSPQPGRKPAKTPPTLSISQQNTIPPPGHLSKYESKFIYTQECLQEILLCRNRLECLADSIQRFRGTASDDEFVFLQENITLSMLTLNAIDAKSIKAIQDMKREAMMYGQIWYDDLEQRAQKVVKIR